MEKFIKVLSIIMLLSIIPQMLLSCLCSGGAPFCNSKLLNYFSDVVVAEVVVIEKPSYEYLEVIILDELYSKMEVDTILVLGHDGGNCGEPLYKFEIGDTLIFRLINIRKTILFDDEVYRSYLDGCDTNYLRISGAYVTGHISEGIELESKLDFKENIEECAMLKVGLEEIELKLKVFPNPFADKIFIEGVNNIDLIELYDTNGRKISFESFRNGSVIELTINENLVGLCFMNLFTGKHKYVRKIVKK